MGLMDITSYWERTVFEFDDEKPGIETRKSFFPKRRHEPKDLGAVPLLCPERKGKTTGSHSDVTF